MPDGDGELLVGLGAGHEADVDFPLSGLSGDLTRVPAVTLSYAFAPGAVFLLRGDAYRRLAVERRRPSAVPLDPGVDDGVTTDAGDFRLGTLFRVAGRAEGLSGGLHLEVKLPNSDEAKGIGSNTTDVELSAFGSWGEAPWRANASVGVGILEAPVERFEQNDVVVYAGELVWRRPGLPYRLELGATGRASTRGSVPLGTEDRGRLAARAAWLSGPWQLDGGLALGYAGTSPDWAVEVGLARVLTP